MICYAMFYIDQLTLFVCIFLTGEGATGFQNTEEVEMNFKFLSF